MILRRKRLGSKWTVLSQNGPSQSVILDRVTITHISNWMIREGLSGRSAKLDGPKRSNCTILRDKTERSKGNKVDGYFAESVPFRRVTDNCILLSGFYHHCLTKK